MKVILGDASVHHKPCAIHDLQTRACDTRCCGFNPTHTIAREQISKNTKKLTHSFFSLVCILRDSLVVELRKIFAFSLCSCLIYHSWNCVTVLGVICNSFLRRMDMNINASSRTSITKICTARHVDKAEACHGAARCATSVLQWVTRVPCPIIVTDPFARRDHLIAI